MAVAVLLVASLALNAAMFVGGAIYNAASSAFETITRTRSVAGRHADEIEKLDRRLIAESRAKSKARGEVAELSAELASARLANKSAATAVSTTSDRISQRAKRSATRSVGSMAGEALPFVGTAVIVGVTALELKDLCDTIRDMNELDGILNPEKDIGNDEQTVCSMPVPTREEIWDEVRKSPERAWDGVMALKDIDLPDPPDWTRYGEAMKGAAMGAYEAAAETLDDAIEITTEEVLDLWYWFLGAEEPESK